MVLLMAVVNNGWATVYWLLHGPVLNDLFLLVIINFRTCE
eukprot:CAMPEP_0172920556 /NCGR_PEP_ID=MMETSP1075-20121228/204317_1 /TAXON_ID=2916 /ORGANISM="Ceratium fusus, Strain PA161109" /LENGTH=39 /DNA_ID= /DNA_START= /DNA_END= /DNA_ORIENTATION=